MKRLLMLNVALLALAAVEAYALPPFLGNASMERNEQDMAQRFDPYPSVGMGPDVVGGRPREYLNPPAQVLQVQPRLPPGTVNRPHGWLFFRRAWQATAKAGVNSHTEQKRGPASDTATTHQ